MELGLPFLFHVFKPLPKEYECKSVDIKEQIMQFKNENKFSIHIMHLLDHIQWNSPQRRCSWKGEDTSQVTLIELFCTKVMVFSGASTICNKNISRKIKLMPTLIEYMLCIGGHLHCTKKIKIKPNGHILNRN